MDQAVGAADLRRSALTNSHSVGVVRDALAAIDCESRQPDHLYWSLPVAGETWDGVLNDINGLHVKPEHVSRRVRGRARRPGRRGQRGRRHRHDLLSVQRRHRHGVTRAAVGDGGYTVGVLVQANFGWREDYVVNGAPVGRG